MRFSTTPILLTLLLLLPIATPAFFRAPTPPKSPTNDDNTVFNSDDNPGYVLNSGGSETPPKDKTDENENTNDKKPEIPDIQVPDSPGSSEKGSKTTQNAGSKPTCTGWVRIGVEATGTQYCKTTSSGRAGATGGVTTTSSVVGGFTSTPASGEAGRNGLGLSWGVGVVIGGFGFLGVF